MADPHLSASPTGNEGASSSGRRAARGDHPPATLSDGAKRRHRVEQAEQTGRSEEADAAAAWGLSSKPQPTDAGGGLSEKAIAIALVAVLLAGFGVVAFKKYQTLLGSPNGTLLAETPPSEAVPEIPDPFAVQPPPSVDIAAATPAAVEPAGETFAFDPIPTPVSSPVATPIEPPQPRRAADPFADFEPTTETAAAVPAAQPALESADTFAFEQLPPAASMTLSDPASSATAITPPEPAVDASAQMFAAAPAPSGSPAGWDDGESADPFAPTGGTQPEAEAFAFDPPAPTSTTAESQTVDDAFAMPAEPSAVASQNDWAADPLPGPSEWSSPIDTSPASIPNPPLESAITQPGPVATVVPPANPEPIAPQPATPAVAEPVDLTPPPTAVAATQVRPGTEHVLEDGDNFWTLSKDHYGTVKYFGALAFHNRARVPDPRRMRAGQTIELPPSEVLDEIMTRFGGTVTPAAALQQSGGQRVIRQVAAEVVEDSTNGFFVRGDGTPCYRIGTSETLSAIAHKTLGRASRWRQIAAMNVDVLEDPNRLRPGVVIVLPHDAAMVQRATVTQ